MRSLIIKQEKYVLYYISEQCRHSIRDILDTSSAKIPSAWDSQKENGDYGRKMTCLAIGIWYLSQQPNSVGRYVDAVIRVSE